MAIDRGRPEATRAPGKKQSKRATPGPTSSAPASSDEATASQPAANLPVTNQAVAGQPASNPPTSSQRGPSQPAPKRPTFNRSATLRVIVADDSAVSREVLRRLLVARRLVAFQESLLLAQERYRNLVESSSALICTHDLEGKLLSINPAAARGLRMTVEECIGRNIREVLVPAARPTFDLYLEEIQRNQIARGNMLVVDSAGEKHVWAYTNRLIEDEGAGAYILGHAQDVTEQIEMQKALRESRDALLEAEKKLARSDVLTDLANRRAFYERAEQERKRAGRYGRPLSLAYIDLDNFKQV